MSYISTDGADTWVASETLPPLINKSSQHGLHGLFCDGSGKKCITTGSYSSNVPFDTIPGGLLSYISIDGGNTWVFSDKIPNNTAYANTAGI